MISFSIDINYNFIKIYRLYLNSIIEKRRRVMKRLLFLIFSIILMWNIHFGQTMSEPIIISNSPATCSKWGQPAFGPDGKVHIVWEEDHSNSRGSDIYYVCYDGINLEGPVNLSNSRLVISWRPYVCTNQAGRVFVVWDEEGKCYFAEYDPDEKEWSSPFRVSTADWGGVEPYFDADSDGNVYIVWFKNKGGKSYTRSRINGEWEDIFRLSSQRRSAQVGIAAGNDGRIWAIWREKMPYREYKIFYRKRTKNTAWSEAKIMNEGGASQTHPHITVGPDNVPVVTFADIDAGYTQVDILICTIDEDENPREGVVPLGLQHFSRIAIDNNLNKHLAWQIGPGHHGRGIRYMNNIGGHWNPIELMANSGGGPELPGISADSGGNVVVVWASSIPGRDKEIWLSSLYPILVLNPPINLNMNISVDNLKRTPEIVYDLSWEPNPENTASKVKEYNIYKKENEGNWELLLSVNKSTRTASFTFTGAEGRTQFGIKTVSTYDTEGNMAVFGIDE